MNIEGEERAGIRRMDRLLSNEYYQDHGSDIYSAIAHYVISNQGRPIILVDWTGIPNNFYFTQEGECSALSASLISEGRSITLYEEVHSKKDESTDEVHQAFLKKATISATYWV